MTEFYSIPAFLTPIKAEEPENKQFIDDYIICAHCEKKFMIKKSNLNSICTHIKYCGSDKVEIKCDFPFCNFKTTREDCLYHHKFVHKEPLFKCDNCGKCFHRSDHLKVHKKNIKNCDKYLF
jgi:hypothetical protein